MPRNKGWFRVYDRMIDSPQILELNDTEFRLLVSLWSLASAAGQEGDLPDYRSTTIQRRVLPSESVETIRDMLQHLKDLGLVEGEEGAYRIVRWNDHQYDYPSKHPSNRKGTTQEPSVNDMSTQPEELGKTTGSVREELGKTDTDTERDLEKEPDKDGEKREGGPERKRADLAPEDLKPPTHPSAKLTPPLNSAIIWWNNVAQGSSLPQVKSPTPERAKKWQTRQNPDRTPDWWQDYFAMIAATPFLTGQNDRGWRADFDWAIRSETTIAKVREGAYQAVKVSRDAPQTNGHGPRDRPVPYANPSQQYLLDQLQREGEKHDTH